MALLYPENIYMAVPTYVVDKIFYETTGSQSITGSHTGVDPETEITISQDKGVPFFTQLLISSDNATWYTSGFPPYAYNGTYAQYLPLFTGRLYVDSSNVHLFLQSTETTRTIYYKIVGFSIE